MKFLLFISIALVFSGCATNLVYMSVQEPAPVNIPGGIKKLGVINRSIASDNLLDKVDQALTLEGKNLDKDGSNDCVQSLANELQKNTRFESVKLLQTNIKSSGSGVFPAQLTWDEVGKICQENQVDALFVLELFDTDTKISYAAIPTKVNTPLGQISAVEQEASMLVNVKTGWRIYDAKSNTILDEYTMNRNITKTGRGINPVEAAKALMGKKEAVKQVANIIGEQYAQSILSYWVRVSRDYYIRGSNNLKIATRKARTGNWDGAGELWLKETNNPKYKAAKRATYNMAIINEINGNLDEAIRWAQKAYEDYGNKLALQYVNILKDRQNKAYLIQQQHKNAEQ